MKVTISFEYKGKRGLLQILIETLTNILSFAGSQEWDITYD